MGCYADVKDPVWVITCPECHGEATKGKCIACDGQGTLPIFRCVVSSVNIAYTKMMEFMTYFEFLEEKNILPFPGSLSEQPAEFIHKYRFMKDYGLRCLQKEKEFSNAMAGRKKK